MVKNNNTGKRKLFGRRNNVYCFLQILPLHTIMF